MKIIEFANQKGGVGKTSLLVQTAFYMTEFLKTRVLVIDTDSSRNVTTSFSEAIKSPQRKGFIFPKHIDGIPASILFTKEISVPALPDDSPALFYFAGDNRLADIEQNVEINHAAATFSKNIVALDKLFDYCLIDTPPVLGTKTRAVLLCTDYLVSPIELMLYSLQGIVSLKEAVQTAQRINKRLKFLGMIPNKVDRRKPRTDESLNVVRKTFGKDVLPFTIGNRASMEIATEKGIPIWHIKKTTAKVAAEEFIKFAEYICKAMEKS